MKTLEQLYQEHSGNGCGEWFPYLAEYDRLFAPYRDRPINLLEIERKNTYSLGILAKYFEKANRVVGVNIMGDCAQLQFDDPRIVTLGGDVNSNEIEKEVISHISSYDLIINNGFDSSGDIICSFLRYFQYLSSGGLFITGNLNCSYWQEFEGGLFYPYSSVLFFKHLADIVNYEQWGIDKKPWELVASFIEYYNIDLFSDEVLSEVHSIELLNSLCIVRKKRSDNNSLSSSGMGEEQKSSLLLDCPQRNRGSDSYYSRPDQRDDKWPMTTALSQGDLLPPTNNEEILQAHIDTLNQALQDRDQRIMHLEKIAQDQDQQIADYLASKSYRITAPLRCVAHQARQVRNLVMETIEAVRRRGGPLSLARKAIAILRQEGVNGLYLKSKLTVSKAEIFDENQLYVEWVRCYDTIYDSDRAKIRDGISALSHAPLISVVMPVYDPPVEFLDAAICSVKRQLYPHWELCIADDASKNPDIRTLLASHATEDERIKVVFREKNGHISRASNSALELATGEFVALLDHDDLLPEHALYCVAEALNQHPETGIIYSDEDKIDAFGQRFQPYFKCDFNYELFLAQNMISHLGVYRRTLLEQIGGFRVGLEGSQDYDLALRALEQIDSSQVIHIPHVLYHWRAIPGSTAISVDEKSYAVQASSKAVSEHLQRCGVQARVEPAPEAPVHNRVRFALPKALPLVSIIIPTRDRADLLSQCINSLLERSSYPNFEIIVIDNGSAEAATIELFARLTTEGVRILRDDAPFNFSTLNNQGARAAKGELLCLMNNDLEILTPDWLEEMVGFAIRSDIGCVGARLWYPDRSLQHGGVVIGLGGVAGHIHLGLPQGNAGYFGRAVLHQCYSAVTGACLLIRRSVFEEVGGLNESLAVAFNDVDFCLRIREAGYRNIWTPYAEMIHHESASRGNDDTLEKQARFAKEVSLMKELWGESLYQDPAYSPNLTLDGTDFAFAFPPRINILKRILVSKQA